MEREVMDELIEQTGSKLMIICRVLDDFQVDDSLEISAKVLGALEEQYEKEDKL